jgi:predicted Rossmann-fold nucleotide-binding protein
MGGDFWTQLRAFAADTMLQQGVISAEDVGFIHDVPTVEEALKIIQQR